MEPERQRSSSARKWWLLVGAVVAFVVLFQLLGNLVGTGSTRLDDRSTTADGSDPAPRSPAPPELRRLEDGAIEIRHDFFRRSTIRLGNQKDEQALFDCLTRGIEESFGGGTAGWDRRRVRRETQRIQDECLGPAHAIPIPSRDLEPGG